MSRHYIRKREGPQGITWYATVDLSRDPKTGKRRQKHVSGPTRKACEAEIARILERDERGEAVVASRITVREFIDQWLEAAKPSLKASSYRGYREKMKLLMPLIGDRQLSKLTPLHVQAALTKLLDEGRSPTTVHHAFTIFSTGISQALKWGLVTRNVCNAVDPPRRAKPEMKTWTREEAMAVLATAAGDRFEALWRLAITAGMRRGELLGLRWIDVDLQRGVLSVRHTLVRGEGNVWESSTPKSASGNRVITLGADDIDALTRHRDRQRLARTPNPHGLVFTGATGEPVHHTTLSRQFDQLTARAGVRKIRFHDCRHTCATLLLEAGIHPKIVQERLGHSSISMTLDRYSHVTESVQQVASDRLDELLKVGS
jgi:integrase